MPDREAIIARVVAIGVRNAAPELRASAAAAMSKARAEGLLPGACVACEKGGNIGHHYDYSHPLLVIWLCYGCHKMVHVRLPTLPRKTSFVAAAERIRGLAADRRMRIHLKTLAWLIREAFPALDAYTKESWSSTDTNISRSRLISPGVGRKGTLLLVFPRGSGRPHSWRDGNALYAHDLSETYRTTREAVEEVARWLNHPSGCGGSQWDSSCALHRLDDARMGKGES